MFRCASTNEIPSDSRAAVATKTSETPDYSDGGKKKSGGGTRIIPWSLGLIEKLQFLFNLKTSFFFFSKLCVCVCVCVWAKRFFFRGKSHFLRPNVPKRFKQKKRGKKKN